MRSITPKKYAVSLYESLETVAKEKISELIKSFVGLLVRNQDVPKADKIIKAFIAHANAVEKHVEVTLFSASHLLPETRQAVVAQLKKSLGRDITVRETVDPSLIGGLVLKYDDVIIDGSIKKRIELLANTLRS